MGMPKLIVKKLSGQEEIELKWNVDKKVSLELLVAELKKISTKYSQKTFSLWIDNWFKYDIFTVKLTRLP